MTKTSERARIARSQLDARLAGDAVRALASRPHRGWVRAIRDALGMTAAELGARMGQSQASIVQLERSEAGDRVRLDTLRRAAAALNCDLVYALVPRTSLDEIVQQRARDLAIADIAGLQRSMQLEAQGLTPEELEARVEAYASDLIDDGNLWREAGTHR